MYKDLDRIMETIAGLVPDGVEAYLVGGSLRDMLMGRESADVDLAVSTGAGALARDIARNLDGSAFVMDEARDVHRVALRSGPVSQVDVSPLKGSIHDDLAARDFTVNAMAVALHWFKTAPLPLSLPPQVGEGSPQGQGGGDGPPSLRPSPERGGALKFTLPPGGGGVGVGGISPDAVIDPLGGLADLGAGVVRALGRSSFIDDPLRLLRAFRISAQLGFEVEEETLAHIRELAPRIAEASGERVRDELYLILSVNRTAGVFREMERSGLLGHIMPETIPMKGLVQGEPHAHELLVHSLKSMEYSEAVMELTAKYFGPDSKTVDEYLAGNVDGFADMRGLVKLCAFLHDAGKPSTMRAEVGRTTFFGHAGAGAVILDDVAARLRMSERARRTLTLVTSLHMRPLGLSMGSPARRALHRLARDAGDTLPALLIVALADALATGEGPDASASGVEGLVRTVSDYYHGEYRKARARPLLGGHDLMDAFGLGPGPVIGAILRDLEEERADGAVSGREDALEHVRRNLGRYLG